MNLQLPPMSPVVVRWITPESPFYFQWEFWLSAFTLLLVVATFFLVVETRGMRKSSDKSMGDMLRHAAASADAANKSAISTQELVNLSERAWVTVRDYKSIYTADYLLDGVSFTLANSGHTPALGTRIWLDYRIETAPYNTFPAIDDDEKERLAGVIGPNNTFEVGVNIPWTDPGQRHVLLEIQNALRAKERYLYIYGKVVYHDIFGQEHATVWCIADGREKGVVFTSRHNYAN